MIITRSPLRVSLGGGGTDLPSYYGDHEGFLIAAAIDKHVYITVHRPFVDQVIVKYSKLEHAERASAVKHPIVREALQLMGIEQQIEITSMSDIPAGTGLGSSGSFTTALLQGLHCLQNNFIPTGDLAEQACRIEIDILKEPVGKQDQYIAAFGGISCFYFGRDGKVRVEPLKADTETLHNLEDNLCLFFTGYTRNASDILSDQNVKTQQQDQAMIDNLHVTKEIGFRSKEAIESGDLHAFAELMNVQWRQKQARSKGMTNTEIDNFYNLAMANGALGGKMIGAGGGGFLMFYTEEKVRLRHALRQAGLREIRFRFEFEGTRVIAQSH